MNLPKWALDALFIVVGSTCMAFAIVAFLMPHRIVAGGPPGIAIMLNHLADFSPGLVILSVNASLMMLGLRSLGMKYLVRTLLAVMLIALLTDSLLYALNGFIVTDDRLLNALLGGVLGGAAIGLIFKGGGASGGWSILVQLLVNRLNIKAGRVAMLLNASIVLLSAAIFGDYQSVPLAGISVYVSSKMIDCVLSVPPRLQRSNVSNDTAWEQTVVLDPQVPVVEH